MRTITVRGIGNVSARPDCITISMTIETVRKDYDRAMEDAAARILKLQDAAVRAGHAREDLKTTDFRVNTRYESVKDRQGNYQRAFAGYECVYRLKLAFDFDSGRLAETVSAIAGSGAKPEWSIAFTVKNPARVRRELLESAAENAGATAKILCRASGVELGQLLTIDYNWSECSIVSKTCCEMEDGIQSERCLAPEMEPEDIDVSDSAAFTWEIV